MLKLVSKVERGIQQADAEQIISHDEVRDRMANV
jgi:hypothetical protein